LVFWIKLKIGWLLLSVRVVRKNAIAANVQPNRTLRELLIFRFNFVGGK
jgi:hypothetical protein